MARISLELHSITCHSTSESRQDEVFVVAQADGGLPLRIPTKPGSSHSMNSSDTWTIDQAMPSFSRDLLITLYDHDVNFTDPEYLVSYDYTPNNIPAGARQSSPNGADYTINVVRVS
jgi:hypothetical protein